ncbi:MAG: diguanylate cyclase [Burkholderiales bacterium]
MNTYSHELKSIAVPVAILALGSLISIFAADTTSTLSGALLFGPLLVLLIGTAISAWFNRGRAGVASASLLVAFAGYVVALQFGASEFPARATFIALSVFVPANILIALALPERGIVHFRDYRWLLLGLSQILVTAWIASAGRNPLSGTVWVNVLDNWLLRAEPQPLLSRVLVGAAFALAFARAWTQRAPVEIGLAGTLIAFLVACSWPASPVVFGVFILAAGTILLLAVLQESHRMAFEDELTGLPSRRALEERLVALGPVYTIGMVDVDHFKKFNDTYGHDIGDQVLRMVGARLAETGGGARAFRYGGEEFCVLFPDLHIAEALPHLEALRHAIEHYKVSMRTERRRKTPREGTDRRAPVKATPADADVAALRSNRAEKLSVTVSIGVAERTAIYDAPAIVIRAADQALYRAKEGGRNRVSV